MVKQEQVYNFWYTYGQLYHGGGPQHGYTRTTTADTQAKPNEQQLGGGTRAWEVSIDINKDPQPRDENLNEAEEHCPAAQNDCAGNNQIGTNVVTNDSPRPEDPSRSPIHESNTDQGTSRRHRLRFVTAPVSRSNNNSRQEEQEQTSESTPERLVAEKRKTLDNREALLLRADTQEQRTHDRKYSQVGERPFFTELPSTELVADLSLLHQQNFDTGEALAWIHTLDPWQDQNLHPDIPRVVSLDQDLTQPQPDDHHTPHAVPEHGQDWRLRRATQEETNNVE
ncbi:hypothetical protein R1sor_021277 [Riccia sorocarpa]|uniref:Uncharacterized protein n=1 Tax=Riccia sorocarpa TaxID=122646 RepID=A0ABD3GI43_9MARC